jgi:hypothetical protein
MGRAPGPGCKLPPEVAPRIASRGLPLVSRGLPWSPVVSRGLPVGLPWSPVGLPWSPVVSRGWSPVVSRGLPWLWSPVVSRGLPCNALSRVVSRGLPWSPVVSRGLPWPPVGLPWSPVLKGFLLSILRYRAMGSSPGCPPNCARQSKAKQIKAKWAQPGLSPRARPTPIGDFLKEPLSTTPTTHPPNGKSNDALRDATS